LRTDPVRSRSRPGTIPVIAYAPKNRNTVSNMLRRVRRRRLALSDVIAEDRPDFKRIDVTAAQYRDGSWLEPRR
jgi:hypothetical protein